MENGNKMRDWVKARYSEFTLANLNEGFAALQGQLSILSPEQQRQQVVPEAQAIPETPRTRKASSVSTTRGSSMYDHREPTAEDLENMPMDKFLEIGRRTGMIDPDAEMNEGIRKSHTSFLPQF